MLNLNVKLEIFTLANLPIQSIPPFTSAGPRPKCALVPGSDDLSPVYRRVPLPITTLPLQCRKLLRAINQPIHGALQQLARLQLCNAGHGEFEMRRRRKRQTIPCNALPPSPVMFVFG